MIIAAVLNFFESPLEESFNKKVTAQHKDRHREIPAHLHTVWTKMSAAVVQERAQAFPNLPRNAEMEHQHQSRAGQEDLEPQPGSWRRERRGQHPMSSRARRPNLTTSTSTELFSSQEVHLFTLGIGFNSSFLKLKPLLIFFGATSILPSHTIESSRNFGLTLDTSIFQMAFVKGMIEDFQPTVM
jgi:hypothetical protein